MLDPVRRFTAFFFLVVLLVVTGSVAGGPAWRTYERARAERLVAEAEEARSRGDWMTASARLHDADRAGPGSPPVLRALARYYAHFRSSYGLNYFEMLEQTGTMTPGDRLAFVRLAFVLRRTDVARRVVRPLHEAGPRDPEVLLLLSEIFERDGDLEGARDTARDALNSGADPAAVDLRLGAMELASMDPEERDHGKARLLAAVVSQPAIRAEAASLLLERDELSRTDTALLMRLVPGDRSAPVPEQAVRLVVDLRRRPAESSAIVREFAKDNPGLGSPGNLAYVAERLGRAGLHKAVAELVPENLAVRDPVLCRIRLEALLRSADLAGMGRLIDAQERPLPPTERAVYRAGLAQMSRATNVAAGRWRMALDAVGSSPSAMEMLAIHAEDSGASEVAVRAWEGMLQDPVLAVRAATQMLRLAGISDPHASLAALRRLVQVRPDDTGARLALAHSQLLLKVDIDEAMATLARSEKTFVDKDFFQVVSVLGALVHGENDHAAQLLADAAVDWSKAPHGWRAVRVAALGASRQNYSARSAAAELDRSRLSLPELALVIDWLPRPADTR